MRFLLSSGVNMRSSLDESPIQQRCLILKQIEENNDNDFFQKISQQSESSRPGGTMADAYFGPETRPPIVGGNYPPEFLTALAREERYEIKDNQLVDVSPDRCAVDRPCGPEMFPESIHDGSLENVITLFGQLTRIETEAGIEIKKPIELLLSLIEVGKLYEKETLNNFLEYLPQIINSGITDKDNIVNLFNSFANRRLEGLDDFLTKFSSIDYTFRGGGALDKNQLYEHMRENNRKYGFSMDEQLDFVKTVTEKTSPGSKSSMNNLLIIFDDGFPRGLIDFQMQKVLELDKPLSGNSLLPFLAGYDHSKNESINDMFFDQRNEINAWVARIDDSFNGDLRESIPFRAQFLTMLENTIIREIFTRNGRVTTSKEDIQETAKIVISALNNIPFEKMQEIMQAKRDGASVLEINSMFSKLFADEKIDRIVSKEVSNIQLNVIEEKGKAIQEMLNSGRIDEDEAEALEQIRQRWIELTEQYDRAVERNEPTTGLALQIIETRRLYDEMYFGLNLGANPTSAQVNMFARFGREGAEMNNETARRGIISVEEGDKANQKIDNHAYINLRDHADKLSKENSDWFYNTVVPSALAYELENNPEIFQELVKISELSQTANENNKIDVNNLMKIISEGASVILRIIQEKNIQEHQTELLAEKRKLEKLLALGIPEHMLAKIADILGIDAEHLSPQKLGEMIDRINQVLGNTNPASPEPQPGSVPR